MPSEFVVAVMTVPEGNPPAGCRDHRSTMSSPSVNNPSCVYADPSLIPDTRAVCDAPPSHRYDATTIRPLAGTEADVVTVIVCVVPACTNAALLPRTAP